MIKLSELQLKEVIIIDDGRRLGHISDLEIDTDSGKILAIVLIMREKKSGIFGKPDELIIHWDQIVRIGSDVILVKEVQQPQLYA
ncbi:YlmC/YmxH family sporulation protein [Virgibacillus natechei]|uniref:YlmC/YmxH family sporulation protein n=1 Tax=Virgibacillus natechei TaxID=1216297 RepID=A0ABS4ICM8_9BACI|nr:YlmC/YmxH family sporulation protein [Virgibacillus natechei]MBP1968186.1 YlmC/YmxH family sporulation protein [Virgibacillus natechei]UZD14541.1 YlmC/YmxH family sporulation protein [Virgibacillus natechei]